MEANDLYVALDAIHQTLDRYLGDTEPVVSEDATSEEIREEDPLFWCCCLAGVASREWQQSREVSEK